MYVCVACDPVEDDIHLVKQLRLLICSHVLTVTWAFFCANLQPHIVRVILSACALDEAALLKRVLSAVMRCPALVHLNVSNCNISDVGMIQLGDGLLVRLCVCKHGIFMFVGGGSLMIKLLPPFLIALMRQSLASLRHLDVRDNRLGNAGLIRLCDAAVDHPTLTEWHLTWVVYTFDKVCTRALAHLIRDNGVLAVFPVDRLILTSPPPWRHSLLDVLKINVGLHTSQSSLLLPRAVRRALRRYAGLVPPIHTSVDGKVENEPASTLLLAFERLSEPHTWQRIGAGEFGQVFQAVMDHSHTVCVKTISSAGASSPQQRQGFFRELALVHELDAAGFVALKSVCVFPEHVVLPPDTDDSLWLVCPLMAHGSLEQACAVPDRLSERARLHIAADVAHAVTVLHNLDLLHRDLSARNVLLNEQVCIGARALLLLLFS